MAQCGRGQNPGGANPDEKQAQETIATVGDFVVTPAMVSALAERQGQQNPDSSPNGQYQKLAQATFVAVNAGLTLELAKKYGVSLSDDQILKAELSDLDRQFEMFKGQLVAQGKIKSSATQAEVDAELKKTLGKTMAELKQETRDNIVEALKDPQKRAGIIASKLNDPIRVKIESTMNPTDAEIKSQFRNYTIKEINFGSPDGDPKVKGAADSVLKQLERRNELRGCDHEVLKTPAQPGKKLADQTQDVPASLVEGYRGYQPIAKLKPGEISDVVVQPNMISIYKLIKISDNVPQDYEKSKEGHKKSYLDGKASRIMADEAQKLSQSNVVKWNSTGYKVLYDYIAHMADPNAQVESPDEKNVRLQALLKTAKESEQKDPIGAKAASLARFVAMDDLWKNATASQKDSLKQERVDTLIDVLQIAESVDLRLEIADLLEGMKKNDEAFEQILAASRANGDYTMLGQANYGKIQQHAREAHGWKINY